MASPFILIFLLFYFLFVFLGACVLPSTLFILNNYANAGFLSLLEPRKAKKSKKN
ncbi:uncharacterized protein CELE_ZC53.22 [Caenorhabditis elegans]|uniref:Uncharacterized protein n=1 Tax=Caenorhabditis elegans TaxID=6239 RepID=A0A4V0IJK1_CAEEL|nr:Uncharacterized protein CELE_ZC53.22 [Caenorhabditis elegans]VTW47623.1 Uncharacterized protein CELE_ZC53.22 [Caenorhabditis elegans]